MLCPSTCALVGRTPSSSVFLDNVSQNLLASFQLTQLMTTAWEIRIYVLSEERGGGIVTPKTQRISAEFTEFRYFSYDSPSLNRRPQESQQILRIENRQDRGRFSLQLEAVFCEIDAGISGRLKTAFACIGEVVAAKAMAWLAGLRYFICTCGVTRLLSERTVWPVFPPFYRTGRSGWSSSGGSPAPVSWRLYTYPLQCSKSCWIPCLCT